MQGFCEVMFKKKYKQVMENAFVSLLISYPHVVYFFPFVPS